MKTALDRPASKARRPSLLIPSRVPGLLFSFFCLAVFLSLAQVSPALTSESSIALKEPLFRPRPAAPAPIPRGPKPAFKEADFPLSAAANYQEMLAAIGPLSPPEAEFLGKNRFLLRPRPTWNHAVGHDEMLAYFDNLGGPLPEHLRRPEHARFVGPDIFMHALSRYLAVRQAAAETGSMLDLLRQMTEGLYNNAAALRIGRTDRSAANWERLMGQLLVPLVILGQTGSEETELAAALARLDARSRDLPPPLTTRVRTELRRIYLAQEKDSGLLGLVSAEGSVDYTAFQPQGYYAASPEARAYFRAATWFQRLGWDTRTESGLADALNFALALSCDQPVQSGLDPRAALTRLLELNDFFYGPVQAPGWAEWVHFVMKEAEAPIFTADTAANVEILGRLQAAAQESVLFPEGRPGTAALVQILPRRLSWPRLLAEELADLWPNGGPPPFSALWLPVLWRQSLAEEAIGRQLALSAPEPAGNRFNTTPAGFLEKAGQNLKSRPDDYWFNSLGASWWPVWTTLTGRYGPGYPLYMRGWAFTAKELETILGSLADLTAPLAASAIPASGRAGPFPTRGETAADQPSAPLVKGFVEPNPAFWRQMTRQVQFIIASFRHFDLFPEDLEDRGALARFLRRLERASEISEKELAGEALNEDDYEFIRLFSLDWMAAPQGPLGARPEEADKIFTISEIWSSEGQSVFGATAEPWLMLVLTGNENSPRLTVGLAYNHYEFISTLSRPQAEELWRKSVPDPDSPLPPKNFWYEPLWPKGSGK